MKSHITRTLLLFLILTILKSLSAAQGPAYPYSVSNSWTLSSSPLSSVAGQNVYRAPFTSGACPTTGYTKLTTTELANTATTYNDPTVANNSSYCYAVTAVGTAGGESGFSNISGPNVIPVAPPSGLGSVVAQNGATYNVQFAWTNHGGYANNIFCGSTNPTTKIAHIQPAANSWTWTNAPAGPEKCAVFNVGVNGPSAFSNTTSFNVP